VTEQERDVVRFQPGIQGDEVMHSRKRKRQGKGMI
jgi:hypothetical protein